MDELSACRRDIDAIDREMTALLRRRLELADRIGRIKTARRLPIADPAREAQVIGQAARRVPPDMDAAARELMGLLIRLATQRQREAPPPGPNGHLPASEKKTINEGGDSMALHESGEDYLEAIYVLGTQINFVRSIDVAAFLGVTKPSVSRAMSILRSDGYVQMAPDGELILTESGLATARQVYERHELLTEFLVDLGVSRPTAAEDACRIEHVISEESFDKLRAYAENHITQKGEKT